METFDSINWTEEAKRLEVAFDIGKPCEFVRYPGEDWRSLLVRNSDPLLPAGRLRVGYTEESRNFNIIHSLEFPASMSGVSINWDGRVQVRVHHNTPGHVLAQGLFCLNLLTDEVEAALTTAVSAHEKLEWLEAYEQRLAFRESKIVKCLFAIFNLQTRIQNFRK